MSKAYKIAAGIAVALTLFIIACRCSVEVADFYALSIYPAISSVLSLISSWSPIPLQEVAIVLIVIAAVVFLVKGCRRKWSVKRTLASEALLLLCTFVWFYMSWCNNYYRSSILARTSTTYAEYDEVQFKAFIQAFADSINAEWTFDITTDKKALEAETKQFFAQLPQQYGLAQPRSWQHPKRMLFNPFYSAVGVQGFMAPLFAESCVNRDLLPEEYPFVYVHEYSHLLGVSNEAEAHWWAFQATRSSSCQSTRYSGYLGILPHVMANARRFLPKEEYDAWYQTLRPEIEVDLIASSSHWAESRSTLLDQMQSGIYDFFLKSNRIESGRKNYSQVVQLLISVPFYK